MASRAGTAHLHQAVVDRGTSLRDQPPKTRRGDRTGTEQLPNPAAALTKEAEVADRRDNRRFWLFAAAFGLLSALFLVWMIVLGGRRMTNVLDNAVQLLAGLVAMAMCVSAARRCRQRWTGWALMAASLFVTVCGNGVWCYYDILRGELVNASLAGDVCAVLTLPLAAAAVLTLPGALGTCSTAF